MVGKILKTNEIMERLNVSRTQVWKFIHERGLPAFQFRNRNDDQQTGKKGRKGALRVTEEDLDLFVRAHAINPMPGTELTEDERKIDWVKNLIKKIEDERAEAVESKSRRGRKKQEAAEGAEASGENVAAVLERRESPTSGHMGF
jgi:hypothetical protein